MITSNIKEKDNLLLSEKMKLFYNKVCEQLAQTKESDIENILIQNNDGDSKVMNFEEDIIPHIQNPISHLKLIQMELFNSTFNTLMTPILVLSQLDTL